MKENRKTLRIGFAPTRRVLTTPKAFSTDEALRIKKEVEEYVKKFQDVEWVNLDSINKEGLLFQVSDVNAASELFKNKKVDAVFFPFCNFGSEEAVAKMAREVGKPVLVWGPRDEAPDENGDRLRDAQCGMFALTKVLQQFRVKYTYISNCWMTDKKFDIGFENFLGAVSIVKALNHLRIGQIGVRPDAFWSVKANERELMEKFGIEIHPITLATLDEMLKINLTENNHLVREEVDSLKERFPKNKYSEDIWTKMANLKLTIKKWCEDNHLSAVSAECWKPMATVAGISVCFTFSELTGEGIPVVCESDIHGAVSSVIAAAAARYSSATFLADLTIRHPVNDNAELLWHCGVFPRVLSDDPDAEIELHFNRKTAAVGQWELKHDDITVVRFDGGNGKYSCLFGHGRGVDGPKTFGTYLWAEFDNWPLWERRFMEGPYIHHCVGVHGKVAPRIWEACKYIPELEADPVKPDEKEIRDFLM